MAEFNPAEHSIADVKAHLKKNPAEAQRVLDAEKARGGDARSTLVSHLEGQLESTPVAAGPKAVTVAPGDQSEPNSVSSERNISGKNYTVTPESGYRVSK